MSSIVVAFPKQEVALKIKKILSQSGYVITSVAYSGAGALSAMQQLDNSILICGARFQDMMYTELHGYLSPGNQMLLIAGEAMLADKPSDIVALKMPFQVHELIETVRMMDETITRMRRKARQKPKIRSKEDQALIDQAKQLLMDRNKMSEEEAHRYMQKRSMDNGTGIVETAQMIMALNT